MTKDISQIRNEYTQRVLNIENVDPDPMNQFGLWFDEAMNAELKEVNAMTLSTASTKGIPSSRIVLLKGYDEKGFIFFTNYLSNKGKELEINPVAALNFFWPPLERQVQVQGTVEKISKEASEKYFQSRPKTSQIGAWASPQSAVIKGRQILEERKKQLEAKFADQQVLPKPEQWGGYKVTPFLVEFWQGRASRLHDRVVYTKNGDRWELNRLAP